MRRRIVAGLISVAMTAGLVSIAQPASATHGCTDPDCNPVVVAVLEGIGYVCSEAKLNGRKLHGQSVPTSCVYHQDEVSGPTKQTVNGLSWPGLGWAADGPFSFLAGPGLSPPESICVDSIAGPGCKFDSYGMLHEGVPSGLGAYCGSSLGDGVSSFKSSDGSLETEATFGWSQSAATILPLQGEVMSSSPAGGKGATVAGFTSSRGTSGGGNCGINQITTAFNVEGMIVTF